MQLLGGRDDRALGPAQAALVPRERGGLEPALGLGLRFGFGFGFGLGLGLGLGFGLGLGLGLGFGLAQDRGVLAC